MTVVIDPAHKMSRPRNFETFNRGWASISVNGMGRGGGGVWGGGVTV